MSTRIFFKAMYGASSDIRHSILVLQDFDVAMELWRAKRDGDGIAVFEDAESRNFDKRIAVDCRNIDYMRPERPHVG